MAVVECECSNHCQCLRLVCDVNQRDFHLECFRKGPKTKEQKTIFSPKASNCVLGYNVCNTRKNNTLSDGPNEEDDDDYDENNSEPDENCLCSSSPECVNLKSTFGWTDNKDLSSPLCIGVGLG